MHDIVVQQEARFESEHAHFTAVCSDITRRFTEHDADLDEKIVSMCSKLDKQFLGMHEMQENRIQQHYNHFTTAIGSVDERLVEMIEAVDKQTSSKHADQDARVEALGKSLAEQRTHFSEECGRLDNSLSERIDALTQSADEHRQFSAAACAALDNL